MKKLMLSLLILSSFYTNATGLFADGFQPSNWGEAINHVGNRIRAAHSGGSGNVDLSALENFTTEDWEKRYMYSHNDESLKENDVRIEIVERYQDFQQQIFNVEFNESRREEILDQVETVISDNERRISKGLHYSYDMKLDACLMDCRKIRAIDELVCLENEVETRVSTCEPKFIGAKQYCNMQAKNEYKGCKRVNMQRCLVSRCHNGKKDVDIYEEF